MQSNSNGRIPDMEVLTIRDCYVVGSSKRKASLWDPNFDISSHNKSCYLFEDDVTRLKDHNKDRLRSKVESLLGQVTILVCLANEKAKERKRAEDKKAHRITNLQKEVSHFQADNFEVDRLHSSQPDGPKRK
ncbi:hypothetical protein ACSQ67_014597 [Phaseolus vulgaris]